MVQTLIFVFFTSNLPTFDVVILKLWLLFLERLKNVFADLKTDYLYVQVIKKASLDSP